MTFGTSTLTKITQEINFKLYYPANLYAIDDLQGIFF